MVLVSMPNASFDMISIAYSNYLLISHKFTHQLHIIFAKYIEDYFPKNPSLAIKFSHYYRKNSSKIAGYIDLEIQDMKQSIHKYDKSIINEWLTDVQDRLQDFQNDTQLITRKSLKRAAIGNATGIKKIYKSITYYLHRILKG